MKYAEKEIAEYPNYLVTTNGEIIHKESRRVRVLKETKTGYLEVGLYDKGRNAWRRVNRLVAIAFIPNPDNKPFVNHIDGNKRNNHVDNLEWVTHQENMEHAKNHNLVRRGSKHTNAVLTEEIVEEACKLMEYGLRNIEVAETLNIKKHQVSLIRTKTCWQHISCKYNIPKRSRTLSCETLRWIKQKIEEGLTQGQIIALANNPRVNKYIIQDIRRGYYKDIT